MKIETFVSRLNKIGITVELVSNYPWVYLTKVNGRPVLEKYDSEHAFVLAIKSIRGEFFSNIPLIFKTIRKYR